MNILSKLPFLKNDDKIAEIDEAQEKKDRIAFHRERVRNGPVKFGHVTDGQLRRAKARDAKRARKKSYQAQKRAHWAGQREAAQIRGNLQAVGLIAYATPGAKINPEGARRASIWLMSKFGKANDEGRVEITSESITNALQSALNRYETLIGQPTSQISDAYQFPLALAADQ